MTNDDNKDDPNSKSNTSKKARRKPLFSSYCVAPVDSQETSSPFKNGKNNTQKSGVWVKRNSLIQQSFNLLANKIDQCVGKRCKSRNSAKPCNDVPVPVETPKIQSKKVVKENIMEFSLDGKEHVSIIVKTEKTFHFMENSDVLENCEEFSENSSFDNVDATNNESIGERQTCICEISEEKEVTSTPQPSDRTKNLSKAHKSDKIKDSLPTDSKRDRKPQVLANGSRRLTPIPEEKTEDISNKHGMLKQA